MRVEYDFGWLDPSKMLENAVEREFGFDEYRYLVEHAADRSIDLSVHVGFHCVFREFYIPAIYSKEWTENYFKQFQQIRRTGRVDSAVFEDALREMPKRKIRNSCPVECSLTSKMLATLNPELPIWDTHVLAALRRHGMVKTRASSPRSREEKISWAAETYRQIVDFYNALKGTEKHRECLMAFEGVFPNQKGISETKRIDYILWWGGSALK